MHSLLQWPTRPRQAQTKLLHMQLHWVCFGPGEYHQANIPTNREPEVALSVCSNALDNPADFFASVEIRCLLPTCHSVFLLCK